MKNNFHKKFGYMNYNFISLYHKQKVGTLFGNSYLVEQLYLFNEKLSL